MFQIKFVVCFIIVQMCSGCGLMYYQQPSREMEVNLYLKSETALNLFAGQSHALYLEVLQFKDLDQLRLLPKNLRFEQLQARVNGDIKVLSRTAITLLPDQIKKIRVTTQQHCRFIVVAAGYYQARRMDDFLAIIPLRSYKLGFLQWDFGKPILPAVYLKFDAQRINQGFGVKDGKNTLA